MLLWYFGCNYNTWDFMEATYNDSTMALDMGDAFGVPMHATHCVQIVNQLNNVTAGNNSTSGNNSTGGSGSGDSNNNGAVGSLGMNLAVGLGSVLAVFATLF